MRNIKLIVTDLDGTLLRSDKTISNYTVDILSRCRDRGIKLALATARGPRGAQRMIELLSPDFFIGHGGAVVLAGDDVIHTVDIPSDITHRLINCFLNTPEITAIYLSNESDSLTNDPDAVSLHSDWAHIQYTDFSVIPDGPFQKISVECSDLSAVERIAADFPLFELMCFTGEDFYIFAHRNATKNHGVKAVAAHLGITAGEIAAFGDNNIDIDMITGCCVGIAVGNAIPEVKAVADYICGSNDEDGVAKWIAGMILDPTRGGNAVKDG